MCAQKRVAGLRQDMNSWILHFYNPTNPAILQPYKSCNSGITPCPRLSQMLLQLLFLTVMDITLEKAENTKWRVQRSCVQGFPSSGKATTRAAPTANRCPAPQGAPEPQNLVSPGVPLQDGTSMPCGMQSLQRDAAFTHAKPNSDFSGSLSPVHGLYFSLEKILSLKPAEINAVAAQINFTSTCYFF